MIIFIQSDAELVEADLTFLDGDVTITTNALIEEIARSINFFPETARKSAAGGGATVAAAAAASPAAPAVALAHAEITSASPSKVLSRL